jgi:uncharacterized protein involved in exopolysaccharide biosynthesis
MPRSLTADREDEWTIAPDEPAGRDLSRAMRPRSLSLAILLAVLRHRAIVLGIGIAAFVATVSLSLLTPREYVAQASFSLRSRNGSADIASLAAQFGMNVGGGGDPTASPLFFAELLRSRRLLGDIASQSLHTNPNTAPQPVVQILEIQGRTAAERRDRAILRLRGMIVTDVEARTGIVRVAASARSPILAQEIVTQLLAGLEQFNHQSHTAQAAEDRLFAETQLAEARMELRAAEDRLQEFLVRNRDFRAAPQLVFDNERLTRDVATRQQVYTSLMELVQSARLDEARDTPLLTLIEPPELAVKPLSRKVLLHGLVGLFIGLLVGIIWAVVRSYPPLASSSPEELNELAGLRRAAIADLKSPLRRLKLAWRKSDDSRASGPNKSSS